MDQRNSKASIESFCLKPSALNSANLFPFEKNTRCLLLKSKRDCTKQIFSLPSG